MLAISGGLGVPLLITFTLSQVFAFTQACIAGIYQCLPLPPYLCFLVTSVPLHISIIGPENAIKKEAFLLLVCKTFTADFYTGFII